MNTKSNYTRVYTKHCPFQFALRVCLGTFCHMYTYVKRFLLIIIAYHLLHTFILWWIGIWDPILLSTVKEVLRFGFVLYALIRRRKQAVEFFVTWKRVVIGLIALIVWSVWLSMYHDVSAMTMVVWLKYDILPLLILVSAMFIGTLLILVDDKKIYKELLIMCGIVLAWWLLRQGAKITFPEAISALGYGPVGDYALESAPPLYYRTWPGGWMRLQWLFSWPNNFGFFLVAYFSVLIARIFGKNKEGNNQQTFKRAMWVLFAISIVWTLSRWVLVGVGVQLLLLVWLFKPQWKRWLGRIIGGGVGAVVLLSVLKPASTLGHLTAWTDWLQAFVEQPLGYGLGSAWPAVHRNGVYLPENHYLQLLLDIWVPGLLLWMWVIIGVIVCGWYRKVTETSDEVKLRMLLLIGLLWLLVEGLFLHVFEDSMVNYLFLVVVGVVVWIQKMRLTN